MPALVFVNKIDRGGARDEPTMHGLHARIGSAAIAMGSTTGLGTPAATFTPYAVTDDAFSARVAELVADHDEEFLAAYVDDRADLSHHAVHGRFASLSRQALAYPVYFGSAVTGAGVPSLVGAITELLPTARTSARDDAPSGVVFKVERTRAGQKTACVRMFAGTLRVRDRVRFGPGHEARVTAIETLDRGNGRTSSVTSGQIARLWGLDKARVGDPVGAPRAISDGRLFAPPTLETVVLPRPAAARGAVHAALTQLAEQDPLIDVRQDDVRQQMTVSLYGEVQKQVIRATLATEFGLDVEFHESTTICVERPTGVGGAVERIGQQANPFLATVGLRVDPAPVGAGVRFELEIELGSLPRAFVKAVETTVVESLREGLYGWQVTDCVVTMTQSGYLARQSHSHAVFDKSMSSTARDFRLLTPLVLMRALQRAGTAVYEPVHRFRLELPTDTVGSALDALARLGAVPRAPVVEGSSCLVEGAIPAARVDELNQRLPGLTRGEGDLETEFERYQPVRGHTPTRPRTDRNPLDRDEYLLHVRQGG